jgi:hypothetical protein
LKCLLFVSAFLSLFKPVLIGVWTDWLILSVFTPFW